MARQLTSPWLTEEPDVRRFPKLETDTTADVVVVGGGISGVSAAYFLAKAGKRVALLEANHLGTGETGFTTAFLTSSVDAPFSDLRTKFGDDHIQQVRKLGESMIDLVEQTNTSEALNGNVHRIDAIALGMDPDAGGFLAEEHAALHAAGGTPDMLSGTDAEALTGIAAHSAIRIPRQGAFNVRRYLLSLSQRVEKLGGQCFEETRMTGIDAGGSLRVQTPGGAIAASRIVLATGLFPPSYRDVNKLFQQIITYVIAVAREAPGGAWRLPRALYWDAADPFHYMRFMDDLFWIGGEDRPLKEAAKTGDAPWNALESFARVFLPEKRWAVTHTWRGQILETPDSLPFAAAPAGKDPRVLLVSGFGGNGMTLGTGAAKMAADLITGALDPAENPLRFDRPSLKNATSAAS